MKINILTTMGAIFLLKGTELSGALKKKEKKIDLSFAKDWLGLEWKIQ